MMTPNEQFPSDVPHQNPESVVHGETSEAGGWEAERNALIVERDELKDQLLRTRAEMDNVRKRLNRERDEERRYAALPLVRDLLPAIDNLERAVHSGEQTADSAALLQGVKLVAKQIEELLGRYGAEVIPALGLPFDPHHHEALQQQPSEHPPLTVLQELERGYKLHDRVIRPSKVIVSSAPSSGT